MSASSKAQLVPFVVEGAGTGVAQHVTVPDSPHAFDTDTYVAFGGKEEHPSPLSYALGALSACNQVTAALVAKDLGIELGRLEFRVQGDLDPSVLVGGAEGNANFTRVQITATVEAEGTPEQFERLRDETERRCPLTQLFIRSGLELTNTWTQAPVGVGV